MTTKDDVSGDYGIYARNNANGTDLTVTTAAGSTVRGDSTAILVSNRGSGALTVTANGYVSGDFDLGIIAGNEGTDLNLTTGVGSDISAVTTAISAGNSGTGALNVTVNGRVDNLRDGHRSV